MSPSVRSRRSMQETGQSLLHRHYFFPSISLLSFKLWVPSEFISLFILCITKLHEFSLQNITHRFYLLFSRYPRAPTMRFWAFVVFVVVFFFASNRFFQEPAHKEDKNREILSKRKQTVVETVYIRRTMLKNSPDTSHTKHSSHLISCYMLWGGENIRPQGNNALRF